MSLTTQGKFLFGEFQVDPTHRIFLREGKAVALNPRTFDLLVYLVSNAQRVVSTDELMRALWPTSQVEESSLTQHIFLLRRVLTVSESGEKLIITVPGRGYQFTAPVTEISPNGTDGSPRVILHSAESSPRFTVKEQEEPEAASNPESNEDESEDSEPGKLRSIVVKSTLRTRILVAVALLLAVAGGWFGWRTLHKPHHEALGLVFGDFQNTTGDTQFDQSLATALAIDLGQSPYLSVTSAGKVGETLAEMKHPADIQLTPDLAREVCRRVNDQAVIQSAISRFGNNYFINVQAFDCATGYRLGQSKGLADTAEGVLPLLDRVVADLRQQLGEPPASIQRFNKPLFAAHSGSLAALKAYADASHLVLESKTIDAIPLFQRAIELDSDFAIAYADLSQTYANLADMSLAQANLTKAYELRNNVDEQDRLSIIANYNSKVTGDITAGIVNYRAWSAMYPRNPVPLANLADLQTQVGKPELAIDPARQSLELNPKNAATYTILARALMHAGRMEDAAATAKLAVSRHLDETALHGIIFQLAYLRHDDAEMDEQMVWARDKPAEPYMKMQQGLSYFAQGRAKAAVAVFQSVVDGYKQQGLDDLASRMQAGLPRIEAELGLTESAYALLQKLPDIGGSTDIPVAWAAVGEINRAETLLKHEMEANPTSTFWQQVRGPQISAAIALNQLQPEATIEALKGAIPYDLQSFEIPALRGRAYLGAKEPLLAEYEFLTILDHPGVEPLSYNYALAQLGLARALAQQGKLGKARNAYERFFQEWQNADPELPKLRDAKQEYAKLPRP